MVICKPSTAPNLTTFSGREVSIDVFHKICKQYFKKMGKHLDILEKLMDLNELLSLYKGYALPNDGDLLVQISLRQCFVVLRF